jgi:glycosyltransferase involved in cell wall biosynthesis
VTTLSAVIPAYNAEAWLGQAIESALAQEEVALEVVVVDDGSTDGTAEVLATFGDRIRLVRQANRGLPAARNAGIAAARGDLVAFLDADDTWEPSKSRRQLAYLAAHPACGLVFCDVHRMDPQGRRGSPA